MPLIEGSRSKNVLANSESSSDLLNEGNIPNGESTTSEKAKNVNKTEVSVWSLFQLKCEDIFMYVYWSQKLCVYVSIKR